MTRYLQKLMFPANKLLENKNTISDKSFVRKTVVSSNAMLYSGFKLKETIMLR